MDLDLEDGSDLNKSYSPPRNRRRSSFFERRETLVPQIEPENKEDTEKRIATEYKQKYLSEISNYHEKLLKEKEAWKTEARQRRLQYFDVKSQLKAAAGGSLNLSIDYSVLSNEDIEFLKGKPNIVKIAESVLDLKKQVTHTMHIMRRLKNLNDAVLSQCEDEIKEVQKYVLEHSTLDSFTE